MLTSVDYLEQQLASSSNVPSLLSFERFAGRHEASGAPTENPAAGTSHSILPSMSIRVQTAEDVSIVCGPVVGLVTSHDAVVLLEVNVPSVGMLLLM